MSYQQNSFCHLESRSQNTYLMFSSASTVCDNTDKNMKNAKQAISMRHRLLDSLVVECWHQVLEVPGSIPSQGPIDVIKMVPEVLSFSTVINVMDKIWDKKSFEVGGHWPLWRGRKTRMTTQNRQKSNAKKTQLFYSSV